MVTKLQEMHIGSREEKLNSQQLGFDRDFWAGSPKQSHGDFVLGTREATVDDVRPKPVCDVRHLRWCGDLVAQDIFD